MHAQVVAVRKKIGFKFAVALLTTIDDILSVANHIFCGHPQSSPFSLISFDGVCCGAELTPHSR